MNAAVTGNMHNRVELYHISHQLSQDDGQGSGIDVSCLSNGGEGGTRLRDKLAAVKGDASKINAAKQLKSAPLKTESHTKTPTPVNPPHVERSAAGCARQAVSEIRELSWLAKTITP